MKKLFSLLLVAALLIGLLAACGEQKAAPAGGESGEGSGLIGVCMQNMSTWARSSPRLSASKTPSTAR